MAGHSERMRSDARTSIRLGSAKGERNGSYRHGFYTVDAQAEWRALTALCRELASQRALARPEPEKMTCLG
jgi:hypothetical protein